MDFTAVYAHSQYLTVQSPNAKYIASFHQTRESTSRLHPSSKTWDPRQDDAGQGMVMIRFMATMKVMRAIPITFNREGMRGIHELAWSPDARLLLATCLQTGVVLVWSLDDEDFKATIDPLGLANPISGGGGGHGRSASSPGSLSAPSSPGRALAQQQQQQQKQQASKDGMMPRGTRFGPDSRTVLVWEEYLARLVIWDLDWPYQARIIQGVKPMASTSALVAMTKGNNPWATPKESSRSEDEGHEPSAVGSLRHLPAPPLTLQAGTTSMATFAHALHREGRYLAVVERGIIDCKDSISIYRVPHPDDPVSSAAAVANSLYPGNVWHKAKVFPISELVDVVGVVWSPDGRHLVLWEKPTLGYKVAVYTMDGCCQGTFRLSEDDGADVGDKRVGYSDHYEMLQQQNSQQRTNMLMGIKTVCWHPTSKMLALGGHDNKIRLLHHLSWNLVLEMQHISSVNHGDGTTLWRESTSNTLKNDGEPCVEFLIVEQPAPLPYIRPDPLKPNPKLGIQWLEFNADGTLLASRSDNMPSVIWIWSLQSLKPLAIIQLQTPIHSCCWDPLNTMRLVWCCGTPRVYCWHADQNPLGYTIDVVLVPAENFTVTKLRWSPDGRGMILLDKDAFCLAFPVDPGDDTSQYTFVL